MVDRIDRRRLDFDFEKICSVTLSPVNVYVCLTCGKFLQGRTVNSPAHQHCLSEEHPLFMNLETKKAFRLPENEEFNHEGLECIRVCDPALTLMTIYICRMPFILPLRQSKYDDWMRL